MSNTLHLLYVSSYMHLLLKIIEQLGFKYQLLSCWIFLYKAPPQFLSIYYCYKIWVYSMYLQAEWKAVWILISWLLWSQLIWLYTDLKKGCIQASMVRAKLWGVLLLAFLSVFQSPKQSTQSFTIIPQSTTHVRISFRSLYPLLCILGTFSCFCCICWFFKN